MIVKLSGFRCATNRQRALSKVRKPDLQANNWLIHTMQREWEKSRSITRTA
jgi:hypothetical protein